MSGKYSYTKIIKQSCNFLTSTFSVFAPKLTLYMLLQLIGVTIALAPAFALRSGSGSITLVLIGAITGLSLFCWAFYKNLILTFAIMLGAYKFDEKTYLGSVDEIFARAQTRKNDYIAALLWVCLFSLLAILPAIFCAFAKQLLILLIPFWTIFFIRISFAMQAYAYEDIAPADSPRRSFELTKDKTWVTFVFLLIIGLLQSAIIQVLSILLLPLAFALNSNVLSSIESAVVYTYTLPFAVYASMLWYKKLSE